MVDLACAFHACYEAVVDQEGWVPMVPQVWGRPGSPALIMIPSSFWIMCDVAFPPLGRPSSRRPVARLSSLVLVSSSLSLRLLLVVDFMWLRLATMWRRVCHIA